MFMHNKPNCQMKLIYYIQLYMYQSHGLQKSVKNRVTSISNKKGRFYHSSHEIFTDTVLIACCFEVDSICEQEKSSRWYSPQKMPFNIRSCVHEQV